MILKPRAPVINWGNPITRGLVFDLPLFEPGGTAVQDIAGKITGTVANSPTFEKNIAGPDLVFADNTNVINFTSRGNQNSLSQISIEALVYPTGVNSANDSRFIHKGNGNKYFDCSYQTNTVNGLCFEVNFLTNVGLWQADAPVNNWYHFVATYSSWSTSTDPILYLNGVSATVREIITPSGTAPSDTTELFVGNRGSAYGSTKGFVGKIVYVRYWNRILNAQEARTLYSNPFQIYAGIPSSLQGFRG